MAANASFATSRAPNMEVAGWLGATSPDGSSILKHPGAASSAWKLRKSHASLNS